MSKAAIQKAMENMSKAAIQKAMENAEASISMEGLYASDLCKELLPALWIS